MNVVTLKRERVTGESGDDERPGSALTSDATHESPTGSDVGGAWPGDRAPALYSSVSVDASDPLPGDFPIPPGVHQVENVKNVLQVSAQFDLAHRRLHACTAIPTHTPVFASVFRGCNQRY